MPAFSGDSVKAYRSTRTRRTRSIAAAAVVLWGVICAAPSMAQTAGATKAEEAITAGSNAFGFDLFRKLADEPESAGKNLFLSPYSLSTALSMLLEGAQGQTAAQLAQALHLPTAREDAMPDMTRLHAGISVTQKQLTQATVKEGFEFSFANGIWTDRRFAVTPEYLHTLNFVYGIKSPIGLDISNKPKSAMATINSWGSDQTHGRIKQMLTDLSNKSSMVLASAVYFKGRWFTPFDEKQTVERTFRLDSDPAHVIKTQSMTQPYASVSYIETDDYQMLRLPYGRLIEGVQTISQSKPAFMVLVLPRRVDGLADLQASFTRDAMSTALKDMEEALVRVELPRFKFTSRLNLGAALRKIGITEAFDPIRANFNSISTQTASDNLYVTAAAHEAFVEVNEKGTEAAAITSIQMATFGGASRTPKRAEFIADHPFLFYVIHRETNAILFMGRVVNPAG